MYYCLLVLYKKRLRPGKTVFSARGKRTGFDATIDYCADTRLCREIEILVYVPGNRLDIVDIQHRNHRRA